MFPKALQSRRGGSGSEQRAQGGHSRASYSTQSYHLVLMARIVTASSSRGRKGGTAWSRFWAVIARLDVVPRPPPLGAVRYTTPLVIYVTLTLVASAVLSVLLVRPTADWITLTTGAVVVFLMALFAVQLGSVIRSAWTPSELLHLGLSLIFGPLGALVSGAAEASGVWIRVRNGGFRTTFNLCDNFLANLSAWTVYAALVHVIRGGIWLTVTASLSAGMAHYAVNLGLLTGVMMIAERPPFRRVMQRWLSRLPYSVGYGLSAWTLVVMYHQDRALGFIALVIPVILLQGFLVLFARRVATYEAKQSAHQKEREVLLQQAVDASEAERRRIARDLHDGVVQNLAGMAFTLTATASEMKEKGDVNGNAALLELLESSAEETRAAMKDLRTLIIEIAPPTLRREGLHAALLEILRTIQGGGTRTKLELPSNMRLRQDRASLIFRVAQEVLRNVAAHADAKHVSVVLKEVNKMAVLRITDDGKGFSHDDVARSRAEGHVGTNAIVELAEDAGGTLDIHSQPGRGTRVTLKVPSE